MWLTNTTGLTLDGGSFSVIEGQAFAGEGLIEPLKAGERRLLSYALDLGVTIDAKGESVPTRVTQGAGRARPADPADRRAPAPDLYRAQRRQPSRASLIIEHPARAGWTSAAP